MSKINKVALITGITVLDESYLVEMIKEDLYEAKKEYLVKSKGFPIYGSKE